MEFEIPSLSTLACQSLSSDIVEHFIWNIQHETNINVTCEILYRIIRNVPTFTNHKVIKCILDTLQAKAVPIQSEYLPQNLTDFLMILINLDGIICLGDSLPCTLNCHLPVTIKQVKHIYNKFGLQSVDLISLVNKVFSSYSDHVAALHLDIPFRHISALHHMNTLLLIKSLYNLTIFKLTGYGTEIPGGFITNFVTSSPNVREFYLYDVRLKWESDIYDLNRLTNLQLLHLEHVNVSIGTAAKIHCSRYLPNLKVFYWDLIGRYGGSFLYLLNVGCCHGSSCLLRLQWNTSLRPDCRPLKITNFQEFTPPLLEILNISDPRQAFTQLYLANDGIELDPVENCILTGNFGVFHKISLPYKLTMPVIQYSQYITELSIRTKTLLPDDVTLINSLVSRVSSNVRSLQIRTCCVTDSKIEAIFSIPLPELVDFKLFCENPDPCNVGLCKLSSVTVDTVTHIIKVAVNLVDFRGVASWKSLDVGILNDLYPHINFIEY